MLRGVAMSFAASPAAAVRMNIGDPFHFAVRQCVFAAIAAMRARLAAIFAWRNSMDTPS